MLVLFPFIILVLFPFLSMDLALRCLWELYAGAEVGGAKPSISSYCLDNFIDAFFPTEDALVMIQCSFHVCASFNAWERGFLWTRTSLIRIVVEREAIGDWDCRSVVRSHPSSFIFFLFYRSNHRFHSLRRRSSRLIQLKRRRERRYRVF